MSIIQENIALVEEMCRVSVKLYRQGHEMSNGGNVSIRVPGQEMMIVKGTDVAFDEMSPDTVVVTDFDGKVIEGKIKPSKEALLHGVLYRQLPQVNAVMHCHSPYATAWAAHHDELEYATHHAKLKLISCPVFDTHSYVVPPEYYPGILEAFEKTPDMKAFLLRGHGQVTVARDIRMATYLAELVEETAMIAILANMAK